jgi:hypothetical protein
MASRQVRPSIATRGIQLELIGSSNRPHPGMLVEPKGVLRAAAESRQLHDEHKSDFQYPCQHGHHTSYVLCPLPARA